MSTNVAMNDGVAALAAEIDRLYADGDGASPPAARDAFARLREQLSSGVVRAAEPDAAAASGWRVHAWVKRGILLGFRWGAPAEIADSATGQPFVDKDTLPLKRLSRESAVRLVPRGSAVRDGSWLAPGVIVMPPSYVNIGAYIGEGTLVDSHVLVGSCAQIGRRVHLSAGAQIGGVLEPVGALPVIVEDDVVVGGNAGLFEGIVVRAGAVIGAGTIVTGSTPVYDLVRGEIIRSGADAPLVIPARAVVVPGARAVTAEPGAGWGLSLLTPVIVKYRDERTDARTGLERWLR